TDRIGAPGRAIALAERGGTLWLSLDRWLVGWRPDAPPVVLGQADGLYSGGPLLVDRENSLWMGSFVGLYQFPEPDTELWTERDGLPSNHVRYVARSGDAVWFTTWQGGGYLAPDARGGEVRLVAGMSPSRLCVDGRGDLWAGSRDGLLQARGEAGVARHPIGFASLYGCHEDAEGALRLATDRGLFARDPATGELRAAETPFPEERATIDAVLLDGEGALWVSSGEAICRAESPGDGPWACDTLEGAVHVSGGSLIETAGGAVWASSNRLGVLARGAEGWKPLPGLERLPSRSILSLVPSPAGGVWIVGHGVLHRIVEIPTMSAGWRIEERLSHWHGLPGPGGTYVLEEPDGSVWVTTSRGLARVPASSRFTALRAPRVVMVDARVDEEPVERAADLELSHDRNRLEIRFAALSFRDPVRIRYQVRVRPEDPWVATAGQPTFRWVDLPAGKYRAQVRASLDGETWSDPSAVFAFGVAPPWYRTPWAVSLYVALLLLTLYAAHRLRTRHLLDLERQRTRIAMDLHDEIGSGLGSVGILSGILASHDVDAREARRMAGEIARTTGELGTALSQIVWALDPRASTMQELAGRLAELGRRLFADEGTELVITFPEEWPPGRPSQVVRRNVLLIGLEALHNAARHARARHVGLALEPVEGDDWLLSVVDDGVGLRANRTGGAGVGLRSMRRRAEEIGAELAWSRPPAGGTAVRLRFSPRARARSGVA
ncbi:MAG TPA: ATP-binding protein, partial [Gemmatimonadota bacterium]|nr:ATP-binding protein [Gemmatimonadota bacterium]